MHSGKWKKIIALVLALAIVSWQVSFIRAGSLDDARQEKEKLEDALDDAHALIEELKGSKSNIQDKVQQLDAQLTEISVDITNLEQQLDDKNTEISNTKEALQEAQEDAARQYDMMKLRIRYMYENRTNSYVEPLLTSQNFSDFLNALEYVKEITRYDRQMLDKYQKTQAAVADTKSVLENEKAELEEMQAKVQKDKEAVSALLSAKESELSNVNQDISDASLLADVYEAEIQAQEEIIAQIQAAEAAKRAAAEAKAKAEAEAKAKAEAEAAAAQNDTEQPTEADTETDTETDSNEPEEDSYNGGAFLWPCPSSTRITSDYGPRQSPTAGASSDHKGIDIGADYGADIVAAADGTVVFSGYSNSAGNYVMIDHGGSLYTVYMHASSLCVSKGDAAARGQVVAKVGSTGISTGNHLHFGVSLNGAYVSPWNYLSR